MIDFGQEELKMNNGERRKEKEKGKRENKIFKFRQEKSKKKETERRNRRFAERAQTDHGVNAVLTWAKEEEGNLGPEVIT